MEYLRTLSLTLLISQEVSVVHYNLETQKSRSSHPEVFLEKGVLKLYAKQSNFIETALRFL